MHPPEKINNAERLDALKHLSSTHRAQFQERRKLVEWRCFFTVISFYVLSVAAIRNGELPAAPILALVYGGLCFVVAISAIFFLGRVHMASNKDKELAERAEDAIRALIEGRLSGDQTLKGWDRYWTSWRTFFHQGGTWGFVWQAVAIACFAVSAVVLVVML